MSTVHGLWTAKRKGIKHLKSQDIFILLKLVSIHKRWENYSLRELEESLSLRSLAGELGISKSEIGYSINRSLSSGLAIKDRKYSYPKANKKALCEFLIYGIKYVYPVSPGSFTRGVFTSFSAPVLEGRLLSAGENRYVWPFAEGEEAGLSIEPLFKSVPYAALRDPTLYEFLALVDAVRLGNSREYHFACDELRERLF